MCLIRSTIYLLSSKWLAIENQVYAPDHPLVRPLCNSVYFPGLTCSFFLVIVIFADSAGLVGWKAVEHGAPPAGLLERVRQFASHDV